MDKEKVVRVRTLSGTIYRFTRKTKAWKKELTTEHSGTTRSSEGILRRWPDIVVGRPMILENVPLRVGDSVAIMTSPVVEIL